MRSGPFSRFSSLYLVRIFAEQLILRFSGRRRKIMPRQPVRADLKKQLKIPNEPYSELWMAETFLNASQFALPPCAPFRILPCSSLSRSFLKKFANTEVGFHFKTRERKKCWNSMQIKQRPITRKPQSYKRTSNNPECSDINGFSRVSEVDILG